MTNDKSGEYLLSASEIRWPTKGDKLFAVADDPHDNANITGAFRFERMIQGYKEAADLMVDKSVSEHHMRDSLVFPIIFNYRHFLELWLKYLLAEYGPIVGIEANWKSHCLGTLWKEFMKVLELNKFDLTESDHVVKENILEFAKIDPNSFSFRYPVDTKGNPVPADYDRLHLPTLADCIKAVDGYFYGCNEYLGNLKDIDQDESRDYMFENNDPDPY
ncbi:MAG: hypothetical protein OEV94_01395 [Deltaproteobacteria bacterium]|nr:hypothetical protein [Deltaproteobacteria bacterium]